MKTTLTMLAVLLCTGLARTQQLPTAEELVPRVVAYEQQYRLAVPSFEVDESAVVQTDENGRVQREIKLEMTLREMRDEAKPDHMQDSYTFRLVDGKPPKRELVLPAFKRVLHIKLPYFVNGVFSNAIGLSRGPQWQCREYRVSPGPDSSTVQLDVRNKPDAPLEECKNHLDGFHNTLIVERDSGRVLRITRTVSAEAERLHHELAFGKVEFAPQKLGDDTFWLPLRFEAHNAANDRRMTGTYSNFHRYAATVKVIESDPLPEVSQ